MIIKTINIQVISVYESIFVRNIIHKYVLFKKKHPPKIRKEEDVIQNMIQKQLLPILKSALDTYIGYILFRKYTFQD